MTTFASWSDRLDVLFIQVTQRENRDIKTAPKEISAVIIEKISGVSFGLFDVPSRIFIFSRSPADDFEERDRSDKFL